MLRVDENRTHHRKLEDSIFNRMWTNHLNIFKAQWGIAFHGIWNFKKDFIAKTGTKYLKNARFERLSLGEQESGLPPVRLVPLTLDKTIFYQSQKAI